MFTILLHSSKTMRSGRLDHPPLDQPKLHAQAAVLSAMIKNRLDHIEDMMKLSPNKAADVLATWEKWTLDPDITVPAIDAFIGDIYSGLQTSQLTEDDRLYAHQRLRILSGLYGILRACDGVRPYRLEMGYTLPTGVSMYTFWRDHTDELVGALPTNSEQIINLSAVEYTKAILPYVDLPIITPKFLTISDKTGKPTFVTVHTKIARGAYARWLIQNRIESVSSLKDFKDLNYRYDASLSSENEPVFVCKTFGGLGLSVRLT